MNYPVFLTTLLISFAGTATLAAGNAAVGENKAAACLACHQPGSFTGQSEADLSNGIKAIVAGRSPHPPVGKLSAEDIASIAAFYAAAATAD